MIMRNVCFECQKQTEKMCVWCGFTEKIFTFLSTSRKIKVENQNCDFSHRHSILINCVHLGASWKIMFSLNRVMQCLSSPKIQLTTAQTSAACRTWWMVNDLWSETNLKEVCFLSSFSWFYTAIKSHQQCWIASLCFRQWAGWYWGIQTVQQ